MAPPAVGSVWINTPAHQWADLDGVPTVLGFWSTACDASAFFLRRLEALQHRFGGSLQVIAVHSPRWPSGQPLDAIIDAVARLRLTVPVLHDPALETFGRYSPGGWPAAVFITAEQRVAGAVLGRDDDLFDEALAHLGVTPTASRPRFPVGFRARRPIGGLAWPAGVAAIDGGGRVAVSDPGHDRIILGVLDEGRAILSVTGIVEGLTAPGRLTALGDGTFATVQPDRGTVVVVNPAELSVTPLTTALARPTAVCVDRDGSLVVSDAAADRLYRLDRTMPGGPAEPHVIAGSGFCGQSDGRAGRASLSQPNGITRTPRGLVFCDAASNNLRILTDGGEVISITHNGPTDAGLGDGPVHRARAHQPVDVTTLPDGSLVVVDRLNSRLRHLDDAELKTIGAAGLAEPEAACALGSGSILVADTGNHRLVLVDPAHRIARVVKLEGMERTLALGAAPTVRGTAHMTLRLSYPAPGPGPWEISVRSDPAHLLVAPLRVRRRDADGQVVVNLGTAGNGILTVTSTGAGQERTIRLPFEVRSD